MKKMVVGVSGINATENPGPGLGVARSLKEDRELDVKIVGLAYDAMEPGIFIHRYIDKSYIVPYPSGNHEMFIDRLLYIRESYGLDFVIPNLDAELPVYIRYASELRQQGIKTFLPDSRQYRLRGKDRLVEVARTIGIDIPLTETVTSQSELLNAVEKIGLPVMIKGAFYKAYKAHTTQEALSCFSRLVAEWGYPVIVQQAVTGEEMNVVGVGDGEGSSLGMICIKKLMVTSLGKIWTGVTIKHEPMLAAAERFLSEYRWKGPFECECIVDGQTTYLIEINPRFPAWSYFATGIGLNLPSRMLKKACAMSPDPGLDYDTGKLFVRFTDELVTDMRSFQAIVTKGEN